MEKKLPLAFITSLFEKLDPEQFQVQFLNTLIRIQNVQRGSLWMRRGDRYVCSHSAGPEAEKIVGRSISASRPSIVGSVFETGKMTIAEAGKDCRQSQEIESGFDVKSNLILCFPLKLKDGTVYGAVQIIDTSAGGDRLNLDPGYLELLEGLVTTGGIALSTCLDLEEQRIRNVELERMLEKVQSPFIIGQSASFRGVMRAAAIYAEKDFPVLITGESGTGKELIAREIHRRSPRKNRPFLIQNCSAIPDTLLESELFGYRKGAFTGANRDKQGLFEAVRGGTIFLDEIGDMPLGLQAKILHVLQSNEIRPLGSTDFRKVDMRIIAATNRNLSVQVETGHFRQDLFYRLNVLPLAVPSLRERKDDIPLMLTEFLRRFAQAFGGRSVTIAPDAMERLVAYDWPGNVREMENLVKYLLTVTREDTIRPADLSPLLERPADRYGTPAGRPERASAGSGGETGQADAAILSEYKWQDLDRDYILSLLDKEKWNIAAAARQAGIKRSTFTARMRKLGISKR